MAVERLGKAESDTILSSIPALFAAMSFDPRLIWDSMEEAK